MGKSVLIVSFSMPPSPDIGGRRWAKFAKYLKQNGHLVKIIAAHEDLPGNSPWADDGVELKEDITFINSSYPKYLGLRPNSFIQKLLYRISLIYTNSVCKGNYYDKSNHLKNQLLISCKQIIKQYNIKNVVCTIPPFRMAFFLLELKKIYPKLNFIVDYRDPWTTNKTAFGFTDLSRKRYSYEKNLEDKVVKGYDKITAVSSEMGGYFKTVLCEKTYREKFVQLPNGFDKADFNELVLVPRPLGTNDKITIVFAGTFYDKAAYILEKLMQVLAETELKFPAKKDVLNFIFIGSMPESLLTRFSKNPETFVFLGKKSLKETYSIINGSTFCSLFLTDDLNYSFSTKFYEYIALKKPIISFSREKGANAKFIEKNQLGLGVDFSNMEESLMRLMNGSVSERFDSKLDISEFDVSHLVKKVEAILID